MRKRRVRYQDLRAGDFPVTFFASGQILFLGNKGMLRSHRDFLQQTGFTKTSVVEAHGPGPKRTTPGKR